MTQINAEAIKELRERTGAGILDCKKALQENEGNMEAAIDWLRAKGLSAAAKKTARTAAEGLVGVAIGPSGTHGSVVELNAETDFVARNEKFQDYLRHVTQVVLDKGDDLERLLASPYPNTHETLQEVLNNLIAVIGENMRLRRARVLTVSEGVIVPYIHNAVQPGLGRVGVLVGLESSGDKAALESLGKKIAMHVAAAMPQACTVDELDPAVVEREKKIFSEQALASGKPQEFVAKMIEGRLRKFYEEVVLCEQIFLIDDTKRRVSHVVEDLAKELGKPVRLAGFVMFKLGEGIDRETKDFAAEVAEQLKK